MNFLHLIVILNIFSLCSVVYAYLLSCIDRVKVYDERTASVSVCVLFIYLFIYSSISKTNYFF